MHNHYDFNIAENSFYTYFNDFSTGFILHNTCIIEWEKKRKEKMNVEFNQHSHIFEKIILNLEGT